MTSLSHITKLLLPTLTITILCLVISTHANQPITLPVATYRTNICKNKNGSTSTTTTSRGYTSLQDLNIAISRDPNQAFIICPGTTFNLYRGEAPSGDGHSGRYLWIRGGTTMVVRCGADGRRDNDCVMKGNYYHYQVWIDDDDEDSSNVFIQGITFRNASGESFRLGSSSTTGVAAKGKITFDDCHWDNIRKRNDSLNDDSTINLRREDVLFRHCRFSNNSPRRSIVGLYGGASAIVKNCVFEDNDAGRTMIDAEDRGGTVILENVCFLYNACGENGLVRAVKKNNLLYGAETVYADGNDTGGTCDDGAVQISFCRRFEAMKCLARDVEENHFVDTKPAPPKPAPPGGSSSSSSSSDVVDFHVRNGCLAADDLWILIYYQDADTMKWTFREFDLGYDETAHVTSKNRYFYVYAKSSTIGLYWSDENYKLTYNGVTYPMLRFNSGPDFASYTTRLLCNNVSASRLVTGALRSSSPEHQNIFEESIVKNNVHFASSGETGNDDGMSR